MNHPNDAASAMTILQLFDGKPTAGYLPVVHVSDKHLHKETEIAYVEEGALEIDVKGQSVSVRTGELISISASSLHHYLSEAPGTRIIKIKFMKDWLYEPFLSREDREILRQLFEQTFVTRPDSAIDRICRRAAEVGQQPHSELRVYAAIVELFARLIEQERLVRYVAPGAGIRSSSAEELFRYMENNCRKPLTLSMVAGHLGFSESYCSRYIKKTVGLSFVSYLNALRVNCAERLLISTSCSITEIAGQAGFISIQTFNRVFRQIVGVSPREYRQAQARRGAVSVTRCPPAASPAGQGKSK